MTLFIAYALMDHIGSYATSTYVLVFILWIGHCIVRSS